VAEKGNPHGTTDMLEGLGSSMDRMAVWVADHRWLVIGVIGAVLAGGGAWEFLRSRAEGREMAASNAFDQTQMAYLEAMGAEPGAIDLPELANPDAAKRIREEYLEKFRGAAQAHPGTLPAALAWLEVADLLEAQGDQDGSLESLRKALGEQSGNPRLAGLVQQRIAQLHEDRGQLSEAAAAHEAAGSLPEFPLRYFALADAARCHAQAGQADRALELLERIESEAKDSVPLPAELRSLLRELRASQAVQG
jgi:predicted negative regulator of RcsB-dependent stress response